MKIALKNTSINELFVKISFGILIVIPCISNAQVVVDGPSTKIVCSGNPQLVLTDISYKNNASPNHFIADAGKVVFKGTSATTQTISSNSGLLTEFGDVILDRQSGLLLQTPFNVTGSLSLTNGVLDISSFDLDMQNSTLVGGSAASYVKTSSTGTLIRTLGASAVDFPVGVSAYNPSKISNVGTANSAAVRVVDNVTDDGSAVGVTTTEAVVKRTWMIKEGPSGGLLDATVRLYWNGTSEEINGFNASNAFMAQYASSASLWDNLGGSLGAGYIETVNNSNYSSYTIASSTSFAPLSVQEIQNDHAEFSTFPNPSGDAFSITIVDDLIKDHPVLNIFDVNGRIVQSISLDASSQIISKLNVTPGVYYLQIVTSNFISEKQKQVLF